MTVGVEEGRACANCQTSNFRQAAPLGDKQVYRLRILARGLQN